MKYMLLIYTDPATQPTDPTEGQKMSAEYATFTQKIAESGELVAGDALQSHDTATTVRVRNGDTAVTDGPFAETTEVLGGYYVVDVPHLDRATALAAEIPGARSGSIEVRPVWDQSQ